MHVLLMSFGEWLEHSKVSSAMDNWPYLFVIVTVAHFFSFFLLVGTSVVVDLRLLGLAGGRRKTALFAEQLFPWTWTGLGVAVVTGFLMFAPNATTFFNVTYFSIKLLTISLAVGFVFLIQRYVRHWDLSPVTPIRARLAAFVSLALWIGVLVAALEIAQFANI